MTVEQRCFQTKLETVPVDIVNQDDRADRLLRLHKPAVQGGLFIE